MSSRTTTTELALSRLADDKTARNSVRIESLLRMQGYMSVASLGDALEIKRSTVSATLYNLRKRGLVTHDKVRNLWCAFSEPPIC